MALLTKVRSTIKKHRMFERGDKVVVAVSGGADSVLLLYALLRLRRSLSLDLHVAHLNHMLRGKESERDARFVERLARELNLPCTVESTHVAELARSQRLSLEDAARRARYDFLERVALAVKAQKIATGHTASDQAETVLLRLLRGAGTHGLSGIPPVRHGRIVRPLLEVTGSEVRAFLKDWGIPFVRDSSNVNGDFLRNRIRLRVLPVLQKEFNPQIVRTLARTAELLAQDEFHLRQEASRLLPRISSRNPEGDLSLELARLLKYNETTQRRVLLEAIRSLRGDLVGIEFKHLESILRLADGDRTGSRVDLPGGLVARRGYGGILLGVRSSAPLRPATTPILLKVPGRTPLPKYYEITLETSILKRRPDAEALRRQDRIYLDLDHVRGSLLIRPRKPGDRFHPFGLPRAKKLKTVLIDDKIPQCRRDSLALLVDREGILWIIGHRRSERAKIGTGTKRVLRISIKQQGLNQTKGERPTCDC